MTDTVTDETDAHDSGGFTGAFAETYEASRQICGGSGVVVIAKHHEAAYSGCLKGLSEYE